MDFYSNKKRTKIIRYILVVALLFSVFINFYTSYFDIEIKYFRLISSVVLIIALIFSIRRPKNDN
jgi:hypothetical protein